MPDSDERGADTDQKAAAESLRRQIEDLMDGKKPAPQPSSLRDFTERKAAEDSKESKRTKK